MKLRKSELMMCDTQKKKKRKKQVWSQLGIMSNFQVSTDQFENYVRAATHFNILAEVIIAYKTRTSLTYDVFQHTNCYLETSMLSFQDKHVLDSHRIPVGFHSAHALQERLDHCKYDHCNKSAIRMYWSTSEALAFGETYDPSGNVRNRSRMDQL